MIRSLKIKNFKSIVDLTIDIGTFNIFIGENGCGKSNILEAIAFGAAASAEKLDFEFLGSRGIRVTNPEFMFSAFKNGNTKKRIEITFKTEDPLFDTLNFVLSNDKNNPKKWINESKEVKDRYFRDIIASILFERNLKKRGKELQRILGSEDDSIQMLEKFVTNIQELTKKKGIENESMEFFKFIFDKYLDDKYSSPTISNFIIFSPEQSSLRRFDETTQIYPLGIKGEGIFQYLKELALDKKQKNTLNNIKKNLILLDWYENFDLPENLVQNEYTLNIKDKYLFPALQYFDQRSTNEGFLYLLFYSTLFISEKTPTFFAIDNIDNSLNPKLCEELTRNLVTLSKKHKKQVIITTQNPAILDGLNLKDNNQRLFVIRRNDSGHTIAKRIEYKRARKLKLSEVWTNGFIGGLPENF